MEIVNGIESELASGTISGGSWGAPTTVTIASGVAALSGEGSYLLAGQGAAADDCDKFTGLANGDEIIVRAASDSVTITIKNGTFIKCGSDFALDNQYDEWRGLCIGSDTVVEAGGRSNNGA